MIRIGTGLAVAGTEGRACGELLVNAQTGMGRYRITCNVFLCLMACSRDGVFHVPQPRDRRFTSGEKVSDGTNKRRRREEEARSCVVMRQDLDQDQGKAAGIIGTGTGTGTRLMVLGSGTG